MLRWLELYLDVGTKTQLWVRVLAFVAVSATGVAYLGSLLFRLTQPSDLIDIYGNSVFSFHFAMTVLIATPWSFAFAALILRHAKANRQLASLASHDSLTGLLNRRAFADAAATELRKSRRHGTTPSLIVIDADHFKSINDTYGHDCGDHALQYIATTLTSLAPKSSLVARLGGEEFVVATFETIAAEHLAERMRQHIATHPLQFDGKSISLAISLGVAWCGPEEHLSSAMARADEALYAAKKSGRNRVCLAAQTPSLAPEAEALKPLGSLPKAVATKPATAQ
jgi:diguanylate cyclase (GGDEF)-like protein